MKKIRKKEPLLFLPVKWIMHFYTHFVLGYKYIKGYRPSKDEQIVVLSNHQTDLDPIFIRIALNRFMYILSSDNIFSKKLRAKILSQLGAIPKRKGVPDFESIKRLLEISKEGGSILIFPEGNRSYAEFQFFIAPNFASLIKKLKSTLVLYNIHGGFGVMPRFGAKRRKGPFYGEVKKVLKYDEYKDMSVEELTSIIKENLKVFDSESNALYKSETRAEYLERMLFVCPSCGHMHTLESSGNFIKCHHCGLEVEYKEDLKLLSADKEFKFTRLVEWYDYQKEVIKEMNIDDKVIFTEPYVELDLVNPYEPFKVVDKGELKLYKDYLVIGNTRLEVTNIMSSSPMSETKLCITYNGDNYQIKGEERFNALKYALIFHRLDTKMHRENLDNYYNID